MTNPNYNPPPNICEVQYTNQPESIIGANVTVEASHLERSKETETFEKSLRTVKRHCNRLNEIIKFLKENYNDYYEEGVIALTDEQMQDKDQYHKMKEDLVYNGLNPDFIKAFLAVKRLKKFVIILKVKK